MTIYQYIKGQIELKKGKKPNDFLTNAEIEELFINEHINITYRDKEILQIHKRLLKNVDYCKYLKGICTLSFYDDVKDIEKTEFSEYEELIARKRKLMEEQKEFEEKNKSSRIDDWLRRITSDEVINHADYSYKINEYRNLLDALYQEQSAIDTPIMEKLERSRDNFFIFGKDGKKKKDPSHELIKKVCAGSLDIPYIYANKYREFTDCEFTFDDLFQTACQGLVTACYYYVPNGPAKFRTYASTCVENSIKRQMFKVIKKKYKDDFFKDEIDKTILAFNILDYLSNQNNTVVSEKILNDLLRQYNRKRTKTAETTLPLFKGKFDYSTAKDFFGKLINSLSMEKLLTEDDIKHCYMMTMKPETNLSKNNGIASLRRNWLLDPTKPYNNNFEIQKNKLMIYGTKLIAIQEMIEYEKQYKKDNNGNIPTYEEQYLHIKEYFKSIFKGKRKIGCKRPYYLESYNDIYFYNYGVSFGFDANENKELEKNAVIETYQNTFLIKTFSSQNYDELVEDYEEYGKVVKPFMKFLGLIKPTDDYRTICFKFSEYHHHNSILSSLENYAKELKKASSEELDECEIENDLFPKYSRINDLIDHLYIPNDNYYNLAKAVKPLMIYKKYVSEDDNDFVVYNKFKEEYGDDIDDLIKNITSKSDRFIKDMIEYRHYATCMEVKRINKERTENNKAIMKYLNRLFFAQSHITLDDFKSMSKSRIKLYDIYQDFDYDKNNNKNCRPSVEDEAINNVFFEEYGRVCEELLTEEERKVIKLSFDSLGYRDNLPKDIALKLNMTKGKVVRLKDSALNKLRNSSLKDYVIE